MGYLGCRITCGLRYLKEEEIPDARVCVGDSFLIYKRISCDALNKVCYFFGWGISVSVLAYPDADLGDAKNGLFSHEVMDADGAALSFLYVERYVLGFVLVRVDSFAQSIAFGVCQGVTNGVASAKACCLADLFYGKHHVSHADV